MRQLLLYSSVLCCCLLIGCKEGQNEYDFSSIDQNDLVFEMLRDHFDGEFAKDLYPMLSSHLIGIATPTGGNAILNLLYTDSIYRLFFAKVFDTSCPKKLPLPSPLDSTDERYRVRIKGVLRIKAEKIETVKGITVEYRSGEKFKSKEN